MQSLGLYASTGWENLKTNKPEVRVVPAKPYWNLLPRGLRDLKLPDRQVAGFKLAYRYKDVGDAETKVRETELIPIQSLQNVDPVYPKMIAIQWIYWRNQ